MKITNYTKLFMAAACALAVASTTLNGVKVTIKNTWREDVALWWNLQAQSMQTNIKALSTATFEIPENSILYAQAFTTRRFTVRNGVPDEKRWSLDWGIAQFELLDKDISLKLEITPERRLKFTEVK